MDNSDDRLVSPSDLTYHEITHQFTRLPTINLPALNLKFAECVGNLLQSHYVAGLMSVLTVYILFADDVRTAAFGVEVDEYFYGVAVGCLSLFTLDICLLFYSRPAYRFSFYFYLDCIATISLIADIDWIWSQLIGPTNKSSASNYHLQEAGKVTRTGTQAPRVLRIVRIIRLIRVTKLYKQAKLTTQVTTGAVQDLGVPRESRIGQKLGELTAKRLIIVVLFVILLFPLFDLGFFMDPPYSWEFGLSMMEKTRGSVAFLSALNRLIAYHSESRRPLVLISSNTPYLPYLYQGATPLARLRPSELLYATTEHFICVVDIRADTQLAALLSIGQTVLIIIVLMCGALVLTRDATNLVIIPIEKMMHKMQQFAIHPLSLIDQKPQDIYDIVGHGDEYKLETTVIEESILKIGALLALSFGRAGARMITANMSQGVLPNFVIEGRRVVAVFGFCDIRNFTDVTESLGERVMLFVNEVASILHHTVDQHLGTSNANIGDAFLFVWPLPPDLYYSDFSHMQPPEIDRLANFTDLTLVCILKIMYQLQVDERLARYRHDPEITARLPSYCVKLGFALHVGWAIEGPIGTLMKIDASYLSPHVNLTMRLQEATKIYGVPVLISGHLHALFSLETQELCRHIDTVAFKQSPIVIKLFTFDVDLTHLTTKTRQPRYSVQRSSIKKKKIDWAIKKTHLKVAELFKTSRKLIKMRLDVEERFSSCWKRAIEAYEVGEWKYSNELLTDILQMQRTDGPAQVLRHLFESFDFHAPSTWKGYRELTGI